MDFASQYLTKLRFENSTKKKNRSSEIGDFSFIYYLFVTSTEENFSIIFLVFTGLTSVFEGLKECYFVP